MAPILHVLRHGQGYHSSQVSENGAQIRDAALTEYGKQQCRERCRAFKRHKEVELLLASPLTRAIQTCEITFAPELERGLVIIAVPHAEEASDNPSDTGRDIEILRKEFPTQVDFNHVMHGWELHDGEFAVDRDHLTTRARKLRRWVRGRPEKEVVLVSHGFFNHYLTGDVNDKGEQTTGWWRETELRTYFFLDGDDDALIKETEDSIKQRKAEEDQEKMKSSQA